MINFFLGLGVIWLVWYLGTWLAAFICYIKYLKE